MAFYNPVQQAADAAQAQASYLGVNHVQGHNQGHNVSAGIPHLGCLNALGLGQGTGGTATTSTIRSQNIILSNNTITNTSAAAHPIYTSNGITSVPHWISVPSPIKAGMYANTLAHQAQPLRYPDPPKAQFFNFLIQIEDDEWRFEPHSILEIGTSQNNINPLRSPRYGIRRLKSPYDDAIHKMLDRRSFNHEEVSLSAFIGFLLCNGFYRSEISERVERVRLIGIELV